MGERERDTGATARSLSVVHYMERAQDAAARLIAGLVDRSAAVKAEGNVGFLVVTPSPDDALALSEAVHEHRRDAGRALMPITSVARGRRVVAVGSGAVAGSAKHVAQLIAESRLVLPQLHMLALLWPEEMLGDDEQRRALESIIAEVPRSVERIAVCAERSTELSQFLERSMWRAREIDHATTGASVATELRVIAAPRSEHVRALRSVLDAFDPPSAVLLAFSDEGEAAARRAAAIFDSEGALVRVSRSAPEERASLGIIFDDVPSTEVLTAAGAAFDDLVAIVTPGRLAALRKVAPNSTPMTWTGALANARSAQDAMRDEIRSFAGSSAHLPWIPIVEPLLEGLDAVEVAATALALLDRERRKTKKPVPAQPAAPPPPRREESARPEARRGEERGGRPGRGFEKKRPWSKESRGPTDVRRDRPRDRNDRRRPDEREGRGNRRNDPIERVPRAARESREWSERGERLRHSRRGPRGGDAG